MGLGLPATHSPVTGDDISGITNYLHSSSAHFRDQAGRTVLLRGINLSASAKTPVGQPGQKLDGFWETAKSGEMSFVGRVLDLENGVADEHLARLQSWGFNCLRYVITWESIEHKGPNQYDTDYIDYTIRLLRKCRDYGFWVYIDPHQDLWSRFSGGSGAPYWTLPACGLDPENFSKTIAAILQCEWKNNKGDIDPATFPDMIWATNYSRLACQTAITMFFAGRDYAPKCIIDGRNIQDWLQDHYFNAIRQLGNAIRDAGDLLDSTVIGWDSLNEPNAGYLGVADINQHGKESVLRVGPMPTAFQAMQLGMGQKVVVENWRTSSIGPKRDGSMTVDPEGVRAWLDPASEPDGVSSWGWRRDPGWKLGTCIWAQHGIWNVDNNEVNIPDYFDWFRGGPEGSPARKVDYGADYWLAHWRAFAPVVRSFHPDAIHFIQSPVFQIPPVISGPEIANRAAHSSHFYDGLTLVTKHWNWFNADALGILRGQYGSILLGLKFGETAIRRCIRDQLGVLRQDTFNALGQFPTMMGEIGVPFDLDGRKAYADGDYTQQTRALDASMNACDGPNALNYTLWCYTPDNSHQFGDLWNGEDLSIWSSDDVERMIRHRASTSQLDLIGKIAKKRSRAGSKASLLTNGSNGDSTTVFGSRSTTPNASTARLDNPAAAALVAGGVNLAAPGGVNVSLGDLELTLTADERTLAESDPYQPINLNDGARSIAAFCRPYPVRTVGRPTDINFDIRSSKFTLTVEVEAGDVDADSLQTEIYVPLIHYAAFPSRISQLVRDDFAAEAIEDDGEGTVFGQPVRPEGDRLVKAEDPRALAVKVTVSEGTWTTDGQSIQWQYPLPASGKKVVTLALERENGAIPTWVNQWARG